MKRRPRNICLAAAVWLALGAGTLRAQPAIETPAAPLDPAVEAALALRTASPEQQLRSLLLLVNLGAAEHGTALALQLAEAELSEQQMVALADGLGAPALMRLAATESLAPEGRALAAVLLDAASRAARDPRRLDRLVAQLADSSPAMREAAMAQLAGVGMEGAIACLVAMADPQQAALEVPLRETLISMGRMVRAPVLGVLLDTNNDRLRAQVIEVVSSWPTDEIAAFLVGPAVYAESESGEAARRALVRLVGRVPTRVEAGELLEREIRAYLAGDRSLRTDYTDQVEFWHWDDATNSPTPRGYSVDDASVFLAARLGLDLSALGLENDAHVRLTLLCLLEQEKIRAGFDAPLARGEATAYSLAVWMGPDEVERLLAESLDAGRLGAALGAVEVLGEIGSAALVDGRGDKPSALVRAAGHGDRRLRFAATGAIVRLGPESPFVGSSRVADNLVYFAATDGAQRVVIGTPRTDEGQDVAAMLAPLGVDAEVVADGNQIIRAAMASADVEAVLLDMRIGQPSAREVLYQLRRSDRTARLPIALVAPAGMLELARSLADRDALTVAVSRPHNNASVATIAEQLARLAGRSRISPDERHGQVVASLGWFAELLDGPHAFYALRGRSGTVEAALYAPGMSSHAARALSHVGRPSSQRALTELASRPLVALEDRQAAAAAFRTSVVRHGLLMRRDELLRQYDRYNASETADRPTQEVLASILDTIERKFDSQ